MNQVVFSRTENGWAGKFNNMILTFNMSIEDVYKKMKQEAPTAKVGFRSADIGPGVVEAFGDVLWAK